MKISDSTILQELKNNNNLIFSELYREYYTSLCHFAYKYIADTDEVEDIVQEIMVRIWEKRATIEIDNFKTYLFTSVKHACLNKIKHEQVKQKFKDQKAIDLLIFELESDTEYIDNAEKTNEEKVRFVIEQLPTQIQKVLKMKYIEGMKSKQIAELTQTSQRTVETQIYKGLKKISEQFKHVLHVIILFIFL